MSTLFAGRRAISAIQSPRRIWSSGRSRLAARTGRSGVTGSAIRAIRFMTGVPPCSRVGKVSQAGVAVNKEEVNAPPKDGNPQVPKTRPTQDVESGGLRRTQVLVV